MATYIPGINDYIPQFQPFTPDYNFLGNILQTKQSSYDQNYKALSQKYGTLLNSEMLRGDTKMKRDEFFKMIDQDIKKISTMDLSLQENVNAAGKVFDSLYQNKDIFKDMTYTKEYRRQLEIADAYKNCTDQEKCGGLYWDEGVSALNFRAKEFIEASKDEMFAMNPGEYTPRIDVYEKTINYANKLFAEKGAFGVTSFDKTQDGKYNVITKNGAQILPTFQELLRAQYSQDNRIIDMYNTKAYVQRKNYIEQNAAQFGGNKDLAEDQYFSLIDQRIEEVKKQKEKLRDDKEGTQTLKNLMEKKIQKDGSSGDDDLAFNYAAAGISLEVIDSNDKIIDNQLKEAKTIFDGKLNREQKRRSVDYLMSGSYMDYDIEQAAIMTANLTSSSTIEADPYAKSYYDYQLNSALESQKAASAKELKLLDIQGQIAVKNLEKYGSISGPSVPVSGSVAESLLPPELSRAGATGMSQAGGDSADKGENIDLLAIQKEKETTTKVDLTTTQVGLLDTKNKELLGIINTSSDKDEVNAAHMLLESTYGKAKRDASGKVIQMGYDKTSKSFVLPDGRSISLNTPGVTQTFTRGLINETSGDLNEYGKQAMAQINKFSNNLINAKDSQLGKFTSLKEKVFNENFNQYHKQIKEDKITMDAASAIFQSNINLVRQYALSLPDLDESKKNLFLSMFKKNGDTTSEIVSLKEFVESNKKAGTYVSNYYGHGEVNPYSEEFYKLAREDAKKRHQEELRLNTMSAKLGEQKRIKSEEEIYRSIVAYQQKTAYLKGAVGSNELTDVYNDFLSEIKETMNSGKVKGLQDANSSFILPNAGVGGTAVANAVTFSATNATPFDPGAQTLNGILNEAIFDENQNFIFTFDSVNSEEDLLSSGQDVGPIKTFLGYLKDVMSTVAKDASSASRQDFSYTDIAAGSQKYAKLSLSSGKLVAEALDKFRTSGKDNASIWANKIEAAANSGKLNVYFNKSASNNPITKAMANSNTGYNYAIKAVDIPISYGKSNLVAGKITNGFSSVNGTYRRATFDNGRFTGVEIVPFNESFENPDGNKLYEGLSEFLKTQEEVADYYEKGSRNVFKNSNDVMRAIVESSAKLSGVSASQQGGQQPLSLEQQLAKLF